MVNCSSNKLTSNTDRFISENNLVDTSHDKSKCCSFERLQTISINFIQNNNNKNNPLYSSECKRLMSRGYLESSAERAAHFEDIDSRFFLNVKSACDWDQKCKIRALSDTKILHYYTKSELEAPPDMEAYEQFVTNSFGIVIESQNNREQISYSLGCSFRF